MMKRLISYCQFAYAELFYKVTWPTSSELQNSAVVVLIATLMTALIVFGMDYVLGVRPTGAEGGWKGVTGIIYSILT